MDYQILFNSAFAALLVVIGWVMRNIFESMKELREADKELREADRGLAEADRGLAKEVGNLAISLPENYMHKNDFKDFTEAVFKKLDRIEDKLDHKADK